MSNRELDNLVTVGQLKNEPATRAEFNGLVASAKRRLADARNEGLAFESRFDLAYNAAHGFSLAALRHKGYRPGHRYIVFQALPHTLGFEPAVWRVLAKAHHDRNLVEYEGYAHLDEQLLADLISCTALLDEAVALLPALPETKAGR